MVSILGPATVELLTPLDLFLGAKMHQVAQKSHIKI